MQQTPPDDAAVYSKAYEAAFERTQYWIDRWNSCCQKDASGNWVPRASIPEEYKKGPPQTGLETRHRLRHRDPGIGQRFMNWGGELFSGMGHAITGLCGF